MPDDDPETALTADAENVAMAMVRLFRLSARLQEHLRSAGMDRSTFAILATLAAKGPCRSRDLADAVLVDPSTVSRQVNALVKVGLIERRSDPEDGRARLLAATGTGVGLLAHHRRLRNTAIAKVVAEWPAGQRRQFATLFERFTLDYEQRLPELLSEDTESRDQHDQGR